MWFVSHSSGSWDMQAQGVGGSGVWRAFFLLFWLHPPMEVEGDRKQPFVLRASNYMMQKLSICQEKSMSLLFCGIFLFLFLFFGGTRV
jgi:hypothetical protein